MERESRISRFLKPLISGSRELPPENPETRKDFFNNDFFGAKAFKKEASLATPVEKKENLRAEPTKKSLKTLYQAGKSPEKAADYLGNILIFEEKQNRLTLKQRNKLKAEIRDFDPQQIIKDFLWPAAVQAGLYSGVAIGSLLSSLSWPVLTGFFISATVFPVSIAGFFRLPILNLRALAEIKKIKHNRGQKQALKTIPFYLGLNVLNLIPFVDWLAAPFLSLPRNKDLGMVFINHRVQTGKWPIKIKKLANWGTQKLLT